MELILLSAQTIALTGDYSTGITPDGHHDALIAGILVWWPWRRQRSRDHPLESGSAHRNVGHVVARAVQLSGSPASKQ